MLVGKIFGKVTTSEFKFLVNGRVRKFEYLQVYHEVYDYVLCQIIELEKQDETTTALCQIIGYKDKKDGSVKSIRIPFDPGSEVFIAEDSFIREIIKLKDLKNGAYIGKLDGKDIPVYLDLTKLLTKHIAILAKSGSGKSYTVGVLLEEIIEKKVPLLIIDPHGEYASMKKPNTHEEESKLMAEFGVKPKGFKINEYGDTTINKQARPLKLPNKLSSQELIELLPVKLSSAQLGTLYSATQSNSSLDFETVLYQLGQEDSNTKWNVINVIEQLRDIGIFSDAPTSYHEMIKTGNCTIINFKGMNPDIQDLIVYKLTKDLFELRKQNKLPPFFMVIEEAHNYCPERSFGEKKSSKILRNIASEGRKFGLGLCVVSQRPARVDKSVISQCSTQIIMKVTNPNDLKAISSSVEGITSTTEKEIQNIPIGTALVTGLTEVPLFVRVRPRMSLHGGHAIDILNQNQDMFEQITTYEEQDVVPIIKPTTTIKDIMLMSEKKIKEILTVLRPAYMITCSDEGENYKLLIDRVTGGVITDKETATIRRLPSLEKLTKKELRILHTAFRIKKFSIVDLVHTMGVNLDIKKEVDALARRGYLEETGQDYKLSEKFIFNKLSNYKLFDEILYEQVHYNEKLEPKKQLDDVMEQVQKFSSVTDHAECYLITYEPVYDDEQ